MNKEEYIVVKTKSFIERVPIKEIAAVQRYGRKITVSTDNNNYEYYEKMSNIDTAFKEHFYRCHSGCIVNLDKIRLFRDQQIEFFNGLSIPLGRNNYIKAKQYFCAYERGL